MAAGVRDPGGGRRDGRERSPKDPPRRRRQRDDGERSRERGKAGRKGALDEGGEVGKVAGRAARSPKGAGHVEGEAGGAGHPPRRTRSRCPGGGDEHPDRGRDRDDGLHRSADDDEEDVDLVADEVTRAPSPPLPHPLFSFPDFLEILFCSRSPL